VGFFFSLLGVVIYMDVCFNSNILLRRWKFVLLVCRGGSIGWVLHCMCVGLDVLGTVLYRWICMECNWG
jgi:hypothetical protein